MGAMEPACGSFRFFDHVADVGFDVSAPTLEALFRTAASALMEWTGPPPNSGPTEIVDVMLQAPDSEELLVRWLQELVVLFQVRRLYPVAVPELSIEPRGAKPLADSDGLRARVEGRRWREADFEAYREVKAVTYHGLRIARGDAGWSARVILDL